MKEEGKSATMLKGVGIFDDGPLTPSNGAESGEKWRQKKKKEKIRF